MLTVTPAQTQTGHTLYLPLITRGVSVGAWAYGPEAAAMLPRGAVMAMTANWSDVEPQRGVYLWDELDQVYNASLGQVFISVHGVPEWARPLGCSVECCPVDGQYWSDYAHFLAQLVNRYPRATYLQIGNEPDVEEYEAVPHLFGCWGKTEEAGRAYARLVKDVAPNVRAMRPNIQIVCGALMYRGAESDFAAGMAQEGIAPFCDAISYHVYPEVSAPYYELALDRADYLSSIFPGMPLVLSETSLLDDAQGDQKLEYLQFIIGAAQDWGIDLILWYTAAFNNWRYSDLYPGPAWDYFVTITDPSPPGFRAAGGELMEAYP